MKLNLIKRPKNKKKIRKKAREVLDEWHFKKQNDTMEPDIC